MLKAISTCLSCDLPLLGQQLPLTEMFACNQFVAAPSLYVNMYSFTMTACQACGLIQLIDLPSIEKLVPPVSWIGYNEPDAHLDDVLSKWMPTYLKPGASAYGTTPFDQPLLNRLNQQGIAADTLDLLSMANYQATTLGYPYLESIQSCYNVDLFQAFATAHGKREWVMCRYLLEHCRDPHAALSALKQLMTEDGYLIIEVPDSTKFLANADYSFIWEEHVCYFTENTLTSLLENSGYQIIQLLRYENKLEDALVVLAKPVTQPIENVTPDKNSYRLFSAYAAQLMAVKQQYQAWLSEITQQHKKVAVFGAGHQAIMFIQALKLESYVACLVDDDANKLGYYLPNSVIPIISSADMLADVSIDVCLLAVNPHVESKIKEKCQAFSQRGGKWHSIFSLSSSNYFVGEKACA